MPPAFVSPRCRSSRTGCLQRCMRSLANGPRRLRAWLTRELPEPSLRGAQATKQSTLALRRYGLLRFARNDVERAKLPSPDRTLDLSVRLVGGQEHVVVVVHSERRQVHQDEVDVRTGH